MKIYKFAALDIGSNAIRILFKTIYEGERITNFKKVALIRVPIRLGEDVFTKGFVSEEKIYRLTEAIKGFRHLFEAYDILSYRACATSAMRSASNGKEIVKRIKEDANLDLKIISGKKEASVLYSTQIANLIDPDETYLYADVGGGSTEMTLFSDHKLVASESFQLGTVRLVNKVADEEEWIRMRNWLQKLSIEHKPAYIIGSGGNINRYMKMADPSETQKTFTRDKLEILYDKIKKMTLDERIENLQMNPDRADVIIPAGDIFLSITNWVGCNKIYVPKIGLADGLIYQLYEKFSDKYSINEKIDIN